MKNKKSQSIHHHKPLHLHIEHKLRHPYMVVGIMALLCVGIIKADHKAMGIVAHDAYMHNFDKVGEYLREETSRSADSVTIGLRMPSISGE